ncbi:MAG: hypothetical protein ABIM99_00225 [Candidatus Dojkabacteria bacterium]
MNKGWKYLVYAGIVFLIAAIAWEAYEVASGERGEFSLTVLAMPKTTLFTKPMEVHLKTGIDPAAALDQTPVSFPF